MHPPRNYSPALQAWERVQRWLMPTDWPVRLALRLGVRETVERLEVEVRVPRSLGAAPSLRIAFASDFHAGPTTSPALITQALEHLAAAQADVILLGGDFISVHAAYLDTLVEPLSALRAPGGVYAVYGNHDHWAGLGRVQRTLERAGIEPLINRSTRLSAPYENTLIVGLDDHSSGYPDPAAASWDALRTTLVLMHQPSGLLDIGERPFDVAFAGHTHGGHIVLPGGLAPIAPHGSLSRAYRAGRYELTSARTLLVSRGVGHGALPFRIGAPADVIVCTVRAAPTPQSGAAHEVAARVATAEGRTIVAG